MPNGTGAQAGDWLIAVGLDTGLLDSQLTAVEARIAALGKNVAAAVSGGGKGGGPGKQPVGPNGAPGNGAAQSATASYNAFDAAIAKVEARAKQAGVAVDKLSERVKLLGKAEQHVAAIEFDRVLTETGDIKAAVAALEQLTAKVEQHANARRAAQKSEGTLDAELKRDKALLAAGNDRAKQLQAEVAFRQQILKLAEQEAKASGFTKVADVRTVTSPERAELGKVLADLRKAGAEQRKTALGNAANVGQGGTSDRLKQLTAERNAVLQLAKAYPEIGKGLGQTDAQIQAYQNGLLANARAIEQNIDAENKRMAQQKATAQFAAEVQTTRARGSVAQQVYTREIDRLVAQRNALKAEIDKTLKQVLKDDPNASQAKQEAAVAGLAAQWKKVEDQILKVRAANTAATRQSNANAKAQATAAAQTGANAKAQLQQAVQAIQQLSKASRQALQQGNNQAAQALKQQIAALMQQTQQLRQQLNAAAQQAAAVPSPTAPKPRGGGGHGGRAGSPAFDPNAPITLATAQGMADDKVASYARERKRALDALAQQMGMNAKHADEYAGIIVNGELRVLGAHRQNQGALGKTIGLYHKLRTTAELGYNQVQRLLFGTGEGLGHIIKKVGLWLSATSLVFAAMRGIQSTVKLLSEVDLAKAQLGKVYRGGDMSATKATEALTGVAANLAPLYGMDLTDVLTQMREFARLGHDVKTITDLMSSSLLLQKAANMEAADAARLLTAQVQQYGLSVTQVAIQVDFLNQLENTMKSETKEVAEGVVRVGATAKQMGLDLAQVNAQVATVIQTTSRSGAEVGRALRQVYSNIYNPKAIEQFHQMGIAVRLVGGQLRPVSEVLRELAARWAVLGNTQKELMSVEQNALIRSMSIQRQREFFLALIQQYPTALQAVTNQYRGLGSAAEETARLQETVTGKVAEMRAVLQATVTASGGGLTNSMKSILESLIAIARNLQEMSPNNIRGHIVFYTRLFGAFAGARLAAALTISLGHALIFFSNSAKIAAVSTSLLTGGFGAVIKILGAVAIALYAAHKANDLMNGGMRDQDKLIEQRAEKLRRINASTTNSLSYTGAIEGFRQELAYARDGLEQVAKSQLSAEDKAKAHKKAIDQLVKALAGVEEAEGKVEKAEVARGKNGEVGIRKIVGANELYKTSIGQTIALLGDEYTMLGKIAKIQGDIALKKASEARDKAGMRFYENKAERDTWKQFDWLRQQIDKSRTQGNTVLGAAEGLAAAQQKDPKNAKFMGFLWQQAAMYARDNGLISGDRATPEEIYRAIASAAKMVESFSGMMRQDYSAIQAEEKNVQYAKDLLAIVTPKPPVGGTGENEQDNKPVAALGLRKLDLPKTTTLGALDRELIAKLGEAGAVRAVERLAKQRVDDERVAQEKVRDAALDIPEVAALVATIDAQKLAAQQRAEAQRKVGEIKAAGVPPVTFDPEGQAKPEVGLEANAAQRRANSLAAQANAAAVAAEAGLKNLATLDARDAKLIAQLNAAIAKKDDALIARLTREHPRLRTDRESSFKAYLEAQKRLDASGSGNKAAGVVNVGNRPYTINDAITPEAWSKAVGDLAEIVRRAGQLSGTLDEAREDLKRLGYDALDSNTLTDRAENLRAEAAKLRGDAARLFDGGVSDKLVQQILGGFERRYAWWQAIAGQAEALALVGKELTREFTDNAAFDQLGEVRLPGAFGILPGRKIVDGVAGIAEIVNTLANLPDAVAGIDLTGIKYVANQIAGLDPHQNKATILAMVRTLEGVRVYAEVQQQLQAGGGLDTPTMRKLAAYAEGQRSALLKVAEQAVSAREQAKRLAEALAAQNEQGFGYELAGIDQRLAHAETELAALGLAPEDSAVRAAQLGMEAVEARVDVVGRQMAALTETNLMLLSLGEPTNQQGLVELGSRLRGLETERTAARTRLDEALDKQSAAGIQQANARILSNFEWAREAFEQADALLRADEEGDDGALRQIERRITFRSRTATEIKDALLAAQSERRNLLGLGEGGATEAQLAANLELTEKLTADFTAAQSEVERLWAELNVKEGEYKAKTDAERLQARREWFDKLLERDRAAIEAELGKLKLRADLPPEAIEAMAFDLQIASLNTEIAKLLGELRVLDRPGLVGEALKAAKAEIAAKEEAVAKARASLEKITGEAKAFRDEKRLPVDEFLRVAAGGGAAWNTPDAIKALAEQRGERALELAGIAQTPFERGQQADAAKTRQTLVQMVNQMLIAYVATLTDLSPSEKVAKIVEAQRELVPAIDKLVAEGQAHAARMTRTNLFKGFGEEAASGERDRQYADAELGSRSRLDQARAAALINLQRRKDEIAKRLREDGGYSGTPEDVLAQLRGGTPEEVEYAEKLNAMLLNAERQTQLEITKAYRDRFEDVRGMYKESFAELIANTQNAGDILKKMAQRIVSEMVNSGLDRVLGMLGGDKPGQRGALGTLFGATAAIDPAYRGQAAGAGGALGLGFTGAAAALAAGQGGAERKPIAFGDPDAQLAAINRFAAERDRPQDVRVVGLPDAQNGGGGAGRTAGGYRANSGLAALLAGGAVFGNAYGGGDPLGGALSGAVAGLGFGPLGALGGGLLGLLGGLFGKKKKPKAPEPEYRLPTATDLLFAAPVTLPRSAYLGGRAAMSGGSSTSISIGEMNLSFPNITSPAEAEAAGRSFAAGMARQAGDLNLARRAGNSGRFR